MEKLFDATPQLGVWRKDDGHRLVVATTPFAQGSVLHEFGVREELAGPTYYSVQIAPGRHVHLAPEYLQYINHGCEPNVHFDVVRGRLICLCDIAAGDEVLVFYPSTEWQLLLPFPCHCGSPNCIGMVEGAAHLPPDVASRYRFTEHIQKKLAVRDGEHRNQDRRRPAAKEYLE